MWSSQPCLNLTKPIHSLAIGKNNGLIVCRQTDGEIIIVT